MDNADDKIMDTADDKLQFQNSVETITWVKPHDFENAYYLE